MEYDKRYIIRTQGNKFTCRIICGPYQAKFLGENPAKKFLDEKIKVIQRGEKIWDLSDDKTLNLV